MLFRHKNNNETEFQIKLGDLQNEKEHLCSFLQSKLKVTVNQSKNKLIVNSEKISIQKLHRVVNKFIYHRNLNNTHYVSIDGKTVKINMFKSAAKKNKKQKKDTSPHQTAIQSWGL